MAENPKTKEFADVSLKGDTATLTLKGAALNVAQLQQLAQTVFEQEKQSLKLSLETKFEESTASDVEREFSASKVSTRIHRLGDFLKAKSDEKPADFQDILLRFPLMPIPVIASKLYLLLRREPTPALCNSWDVLRHFQIVVDELLKDPVVDKAGKRKVMTQREQTLDSMIDFVCNTLSRLFVLPIDEDVASIFIRENYYSSINAIRIWEFTLLDLLGIPQRLQSTIVTPMEYEAKSFDTTSSYNVDVLATYMDQTKLAESFLTFYTQHKRLAASKTIGSSAPEEFVLRSKSEKWPNAEFGKIFHDVVRQTTSNVLFYCGNHEICGRHEERLNQFNKCSRCFWVRYCSKECQIFHWQSKHKMVCMKKVDAAAIEETLRGRRIIISTEEDDLVTKKANGRLQQQGQAAQKK